MILPHVLSPFCPDNASFDLRTRVTTYHLILYVCNLVIKGTRITRMERIYADFTPPTRPFTRICFGLTTKVRQCQMIINEQLS